GRGVHGDAPARRGGLRQRGRAALRRLGDVGDEGAPRDRARRLPAREPDAPLRGEGQGRGQRALLLRPGRRQGDGARRAGSQDHPLGQRGRGRGPFGGRRGDRARHPLLRTGDRGGL
ncbi:MAG: FIG022979: MoxR-like ATPases, partial [uncultured Rubrobacteraceae bacterium]